MIRYIDTHFHALHMQARGIPMPDKITELYQEGFIGGIDAGTHYSDIQERHELLKAFPGIYLSGGIHPGSLTREPLEQLASGMEALYQAAQSGLIRFIGECGIDLYRDPDSLRSQEELFMLHVKAAAELNLPIIIHNREADSEILTLLRESPPPRGGIMHCFSSDARFAGAVQELGLHISFAGNITYRKNTYLAEAIRCVSADRLLLETDSPFLSPVPLRGRTNHPGNIIHTYEFAAKILDIPIEQLSEFITASMENLGAPIT